jgi:hypothetical protein
VAKDEKTPAYRRVPGALWGFIDQHVLFMLPVKVPELEEGKHEYQELEVKLAEAAAALAQMPAASLELMTGAMKDELARVLSDIDDVRSRAGQLLAATGFVSVLASIGSALPQSKPLILLTYGLIGLAIYGLLGTLWLTTQAARVRTWEVTVFEPFGAFEPVNVSEPLAVLHPDPAQQSRHLKERYVTELYRACKRDALRLEIPAGYLSDAQWFFFGTIAAIVVLVALHF